MKVATVGWAQRLRRILHVLWFAGIALPVAPSTGLALPIDDALTDWQTAGSVSSASGIATLSDPFGDGVSSLVHQGAALDIGETYRLSFDVSVGTSSSLPSGGFGFPDTFFASLYLTDDISSFSLAPGGFDAATSLLSADFGGVTGGLASAGSSPLGIDWQRISFDFTAEHAWAVPTFELFAQNGTAGDSSVQVTNVALARTVPAIPEPSAALAFGVGLLVCMRAVRRRA